MEITEIHVIELIWRTNCCLVIVSQVVHFKNYVHQPEAMVEMLHEAQEKNQDGVLEHATPDVIHSLKSFQNG